jgi:hypothetical protein
MVSDVSPAVYLIERNMFLLKELFTHEQVLHDTTFAEGKHMRVFYENQVVRSRGGGFNPTIFSFLINNCLKECFLLLPSLFIVF